MYRIERTDVNYILKCMNTIQGLKGQISIYLTRIPVTGQYLIFDIPDSFRGDVQD